MKRDTAIQKMAAVYCKPQFANKVVDVDLVTGFADVLKQETDKILNDFEFAWALICNVSEGDWKKQSQEWQDAAQKVRDRFHAHLPKD